ncbi:hypothetical protein JW721_00505 [Candidatus Micrarchaeota archaeon]|nr:hypothetical protein [Candidatus Micrarchaeota archaeon]
MGTTRRMRTSRATNRRAPRCPFPRGSLESAENLDKMCYVPLAVAWNCLESACLEGGNPIKCARYRARKGKMAPLSRVFTSAFKACGGVGSLCALRPEPLPNGPKECLGAARRELASFIEDGTAAASALRRLLGKNARADIGGIILGIEGVLQTLDCYILGHDVGWNPRRKAYVPVEGNSREERIAAFVSRMKKIWEREGKLP